MATYAFMGDAPAVAQVDLITLVANAALETTDNLIGTVNGKNMSVAAGSTDVDTAVDTFNAAWEASTIPEHEEIAATDGGTGIAAMTAVTPGRSFTLTASTTETGGGASDGQTFTRSASVANDGPNVWSASNFKDVSTGARGVLPGGSAGDVVTLQEKSVSIEDNLDQSGIANAVVYQQFKSFRGRVGRRRTNTYNTLKPYDEYREKYLKLKCSHARIGEGGGTGSPHTWIDFGSTACKCKVFGSPAATNGEPPIRLLGTAAANELEITGGSVGIALDSGEVSTFDEIFVSGSGELRIGAGVTMGRINASGNARVHVNWRTAGLANIYLTENAQLWLYGGISNDASTALTINEIYVRSFGQMFLLCEGGTSANLYVGASAVLDASGGIGKTHASVVNVFTITNLAFVQAGTSQRKTKVHDPGKRIFWQAGLQVDGLLADCDINIGSPSKLFVGGGSLS